MAIVLASASPRRRELMEMFAAQNLVICPAKGEEKVPAGATPGETVEALARAKAREIAAARRGESGESEDDVIIGADTIVWHCDRIYGKPHSREEAAEMLRSLYGETHEDYTGVCVLHGEEELCAHERTFVSVRKMSEREIEAYIDTGEPMDKAGAYGAQGIGSLFVTGIEGDFFNVMGLPVCRLGQMLKKTGVELL